MALDPIAERFASDNTWLYTQRWLTCAQVGFGMRRHIPADLVNPFVNVVQGRATLNDAAVKDWVWRYLYNAKLNGSVPDLPQVSNWNDHVRTLKAVKVTQNVLTSLFRFSKRF